MFTFYPILFYLSLSDLPPLHVQFFLNHFKLSCRDLMLLPLLTSVCFLRTRTLSCINTLCHQKSGNLALIQSYNLSRVRIQISSGVTIMFLLKDGFPRKQTLGWRLVWRNFIRSTLRINTAEGERRRQSVLDRRRNWCSLKKDYAIPWGTLKL